MRNANERFSFPGPNIWEIIPENIKKLESLNSFKKEIKKWKPNEWYCRLRKTYIGNVAFLALFLS